MQPQQQQNQQQQQQQQAQQQQMRQFLAQLQQQQQLQQAAAQRQQTPQSNQRPAAPAAANPTSGTPASSAEAHDARAMQLLQQMQIQQAQQLAVQAAQHHQQLQGHPQAAALQSLQNLNPANAAATMQWLQQVQLQQLAAAQANNLPEGLNWFQQQLQLQQQQQQLNLFLQLQQQQQQQQQQNPGQGNEFQRVSDLQQRRLLEQQQRLPATTPQGRRGQGKPETGSKKYQTKKGSGEKTNPQAVANQADQLLKQQQQQNLEQQLMQQQMQKLAAQAQSVAQPGSQPQPKPLKPAPAAPPPKASQKEGRDKKPIKQTPQTNHGNGSSVATQLRKEESEITKLPSNDSSKKRKNGEKKEVKAVKESKKQIFNREVMSLPGKVPVPAVDKIKHEAKEPKKRRVELLRDAKSLPHMQKNDAYKEGELSLTIATSVEGSSDAITFKLQETPKCEVVDVADEKAILSLLKKAAVLAEDTLVNWVRIPQANWLKGMIDDLSEEALERVYKKHQSLQTLYYTTDDSDSRWGSLTEFTEVILSEWFDGRSLQDIVAHAQKLGQLDVDGGVVIKGDGVDSVLCKGSRPVDVQELCSQLNLLLGKSDGISVYSLERKNFFMTGKTEFVKDYDELERKIKAAASENEAIGSLNTTFDYSPTEDTDVPESGVEALDSYYATLDGLSYSVGESGPVVLNKQLYLIWKFPNYMTSYHQDNHIFPHITVYQQTSGYSVFHFLPVLVGLYITHVSKTKKAVEIQRMLEELDRARIGSYAIIGPGDAAVIYPFGSHGVYVPSLEFNPFLSPFEVSQVRAAEFIVNGVRKTLRRDYLDKEEWNTVMPDRGSDKELLNKAEIGLNSIKESLMLSSDEFKWVINRVWRKWQTSEN